MFKTILTTLLFMGLVLLQACADDPEDPRSEIKLMLAEIEGAAEERSISGVSGYLATDYQDRHHRNSQAVKRSLLGYFHRHRSIYLFTNIKDITIDETVADQARAVINVAMTGTQVDTEEALLLLKADVYQFNLDLVKQEDQWLVKSSNWKRIKITEF